MWPLGLQGANATFWGCILGSILGMTPPPPTHTRLGPERRLLMGKHIGKIMSCVPSMADRGGAETQNRRGFYFSIISLILCHQNWFNKHFLYTFASPLYQIFFFSEALK